MQHRATLNYSERLVVQAVRAYWRKVIGPAYLFAVTLLIVLLAWQVLDGDRSWGVGLTAAVALLGVAMPIAVYVAHYRNSMGKFRELSQPVAQFLADDQGFTLSSDRGSATLKWNAVTEVWRYDTMWLLLFSKAQFVTIPLQDVPAPMQAFILERVQAAGGRISA